MLEILHQLLPQLTRAEKIEMLAHLKEAIAEELIVSSEGNGPSVCPHCGCARFTKKGHGRSREQRWLCGGCARTFSGATKGLLANSKLSGGAWMSFAACMVDALSLRESAKRCNTCLSTAWFMRHRLCEVMAKRLMPFRVGKGSACQIDETIVNENLSGNWTRSGSVSLPRKPHKRGNAIHVSGSSRERISILTGISDRGDCFCEVCCRGKSSIEDIEALLKGKVEKGAIVSSDWDAAYPKALASIGAGHRRYCTSSGKGYKINMVNALHSRLRDFLFPFKGVSTRRLKHYLDWFCYVEQFRKSDADRREVLYSNAISGTYETTRRNYPSTPFPFGEYWNMSTVV
ncbi:IS1595 family transposase [Raoultibacter phocaeensis]|uniref:IS1595 family transposase n=1 Tax=Raoultibacter phocaeensis TaxID=2479841 RepID=UPI00111904D0|nr:IS1595 family transposase [Raoultibacter phocaeensis]